jgi:Domain of unknown function (DUF4351)
MQLRNSLEKLQSYREYQHHIHLITSHRHRAVDNDVPESAGVGTIEPYNERHEPSDAHGFDSTPLAQVQALALPQLETLGEALLDFAVLDDLSG